MNNLLGTLSRLVTARPYITLIVLLGITAVMAAGTNFRAPPTEGASVDFLPPGHPIADAAEEIDESFGDSSRVSVVTIIFRGEALTPEGLAQMDDLIREVITDPAVGPFLTTDNPVVAPAFLVNAVLQVDDLGSVSQAQIDSARNAPGIGEAIDAMTGIDENGTPIAIANIRLTRYGR